MKELDLTSSISNIKVSPSVYTTINIVKSKQTSGKFYQL